MEIVLITPLVWTGIFFFFYVTRSHKFGFKDTRVHADKSVRGGRKKTQLLEEHLCFLHKVITIIIMIKKNRTISIKNEKRDLPVGADDDMVMIWL